ncbi:MAG: RagB/SusD family nutrient uptake outer membrane protein [Saprospiraceae bacterium]|nr:RagB/SusD family nutrient uptake outer membrane protein [Saprospiraceae bacterium]
MNKIKYIVCGLVFSMVLAQMSCTIKEYTDPSAISDTQVIANVDGLVGLCNGLQLRYSVGRQSPLYQGFSASGLMAGEQKVLNLGNAEEVNLANGGAAVTAANTILSGIWSQSFLALNEANRILDNLSVATDPSVQGVLQGYASIYKAMAFGTLAVYYEKMPVTIGKNQPFVSREDALRQAVILLENAEKVVGTGAIPTSISGKLVLGVDLKNTIVALQARYNLMLKDYTKALAAANKVSLTVKSAFKYDAVNTNPIFFVSYSNRNVLEPVNRAFGLPAALAPDTTDKRIAFYMNPAASTTVNLGFGFPKTSLSDIPVYLPGEIRLIKAECLAQSDLPGATAELNAVIKKKATEDAWGVGADIAAGYTGASTKDAILTQVYRQRCIELAFSGLRFEDSRRLGRPGPEAPAASRERNRNFVPYPQNERDNNTSIPADPAN